MAHARIAGLHQQLRRRVVELVGAHRLDETQIVDLSFQVRQPIGDPGAVLAGLMEGILGTQQLGHATDEGKALAGQVRLRTVRAVEARQHRLVFEQFQLAGRPAHVQVDHAPHLGRELRRQQRERSRRITPEIQPRFLVGFWRCCLQGLRRKAGHATHEHRAEATRATQQEMPAGLRLQLLERGIEFVVLAIHGHYLVNAASRLNSTLASAV